MITAFLSAAAAALPPINGSGDPCMMDPPTQANADACLAGNTPITGAPGRIVSATAGSAISDALNGLFSWIQDSMAAVATSVASFWTSTPTVAVGDTSGAPSDAVGFIRDHLTVYVALIAVASVIIGGVKIAVSGRPGGLAELGTFLVRIALAGAFSIAVCAALIDVIDAFSGWIIGEASNGTDLGANLAGLFAMPGMNVVGLVCLVIMLLSSLFLVAMMWVRSAVLVLAVGMLPMAAAVWTPAWFSRLAKTIMATILVKPLASLVLAVGFRLLGSNTSNGGATEAVVGAVILVTACWSWKFLVKVIAPYDDPMGQTGLGGVVARVAAFVAIVAR
jgi:type IV secretion system protein TrbL